jgi:hypothetical protein
MIDPERNFSIKQVDATILVSWTSPQPGTRDFAAMGEAIHWIHTQRPLRQS